MGKYVNVQKQQYSTKGFSDVKLDIFFSSISLPSLLQWLATVWLYNVNSTILPGLGTEDVQNLKSDKDVVKPI